MHVTKCVQLKLKRFSTKHKVGVMTYYKVVLIPSFIFSSSLYFRNRPNPNIKQHLEAPSLPLSEATRSCSSDEDDFFSEVLKTPQAQDGSEELDGYLAFSADHMESLKSFPAVCRLSLKLSTPPPASAACERLFSIAGLVFSPRRARLCILLRMNKRFFSFKWFFYFYFFTLGAAIIIFCSILK